MTRQASPGVFQFLIILHDTFLILMNVPLM